MRMKENKGKIKIGRVDGKRCDILSDFDWDEASLKKHACIL